MQIMEIERPGGAVSVQVTVELPYRDDIANRDFYIFRQTRTILYADRLSPEALEQEKLRCIIHACGEMSMDIDSFIKRGRK